MASFNPHFRDAYRMIYGLSGLHKEELQHLAFWWEWKTWDGVPIQLVPMLDMTFRDYSNGVVSPTNGLTVD